MILYYAIQKQKKINKNIKNDKMYVFDSEISGTRSDIFYFWITDVVTEFPDKCNVQKIIPIMINN